MSDIVKNLPYGEYAKRKGINASVLKMVHRKSLLHAHAYMNGSYREESDVLDFGHCFHSLALEGKTEFVVKPETYTNDKGEEKDWNANSKVCQKWLADHPDSVALTEAKASSLHSMAKAVRDELGDDLLSGDVELSLFAERDGHPVKARADLVPYDSTAPIIDLKSCESAEPAKFLRSSLDLGYHIQAALSLDVARLCGINRKSFWLVGVEKQAPYATSVLKFDDVSCSFLRVGRLHYRAAFQNLTAAMKSGHWDAYGRHAAEEFAPAWFKDVLDQTA